MRGSGSSDVLTSLPIPPSPIVAHHNAVRPALSVASEIPSRRLAVNTYFCRAKLGARFLVLLFGKRRKRSDRQTNQQGQQEYSHHPHPPDDVSRIPSFSPPSKCNGQCTLRANSGRANCPLLLIRLRVCRFLIRGGRLESAAASSRASLKPPVFGGPVPSRRRW